MLVASVLAPLSALLGSAPNARPAVHLARTRPLVLAENNCPLDELRNTLCPLTGSGNKKDGEKREPPSISKVLGDAEGSISRALDEVENLLIDRAGLPRQPLACQAAEAAVNTIVRTTAEELGSLAVSFNASSSAGLLLRGELLSARVEATAIASAGLRASSLTLSSDGVDFVVPKPFETTPPNLKSPATVGFSVRCTQDDINRSPVIFGALQEILREVVRTGVSAAIGEALPRDRDGLVISLVSVEPPQDGRLVLVADAEATQSDGSVMRLSGMRVRTTPKVSATQGNMLVLDRPELVSSFEGFGAKVEVGLPFLRAAGVPLPPDVNLKQVTVSDGAIRLDGNFVLRPIDYEGLLATAAAAAQDLQDLQQQQQQQQQARATKPQWEGGDAVAVDVEATSDDEPAGGSAAASRALPKAK